MTNLTISHYYKWLSLVTLIVSIVGAITLIEETIATKFLIGLLVNIQFHLAFQFLSRVPFGIYQHVEKKNPRMKRLTRRFLNFFSWIIMITSIIGFVGFINSVIIHREYKSLMATMTFISIFLGGYSSYSKSRETPN